MAAITKDRIRALAGFKGADAPVTSCYLDVDGRRFPRHQDYQRELDMLIRRSMPTGATASVSEDVRRIESYVRAGLDRSDVRGLALFACHAHRFWEVVELPVRVRSQLVVNHSPAIAQLEAVAEESERFAVLLTDRQRARLFVFEMGQTVDRTELFDDLSRGDNEDSRSTASKARVDNQAEEMAHQHLRNAAKVTFELFQRNGFDHLILAATPEVAKDLHDCLHPYLRERVADRAAIAVNSTDEQIRRAAMEVEAGVERRKEAKAVARLREGVGAKNKAVAGLGPVLDALVQRRVDRLLVSDGYAEQGWRCEACGCLGLVGRSCPACAATMVEVDDIVEEALEEALIQSCRVEVCFANPDLDVLGRIGALLRY